MLVGFRYNFSAFSISSASRRSGLRGFINLSFTSLSLIACSRSFASRGFDGTVVGADSGLSVALGSSAVFESFGFLSAASVFGFLSSPAFGAFSAGAGIQVAGLVTG